MITLLVCMLEEFKTKNKRYFLFKKRPRNCSNQVNILSPKIRFLEWKVNQSWEHLTDSSISWGMSYDTLPLLKNIEPRFRVKTFGDF